MGVLSDQHNEWADQQALEARLEADPELREQLRVAGWVSPDVRRTDIERARADALREAADHFDRFDVVTIGKTDIGSNQIPVPPAERLRLLADEIEEAHDANH